MAPEVQLTVGTQAAELHFLVWLEPAQPEQCRYQRKRVDPTFLTYTQGMAYCVSSRASNAGSGAEIQDYAECACAEHDGRRSLLGIRIEVARFPGPILPYATCLGAYGIEYTSHHLASR